VDRLNRRAFSTLHGPVHAGGAPNHAAFLEGLFKVRVEHETELTHGFHPYAARLHPSIARSVIDRLSRPGQRVCDPFCGSGTVLVEAMAAGRDVVGSDASALAVEVSRVKTEPLSPALRERLVELGQSLGEASSERARGRQRPQNVPRWARRGQKVFSPNVFLELLGLRELMHGAAEDDGRIVRALRMAFSSLLGKYAAAADKRVGRGLPSALFSDRVRSLALGLQALEQASEKSARSVRPEIVSSDARNLESIPTASVNLVVTSPPYAGTYDYASLHEIRYQWLGLPIGRFRKAQVGQPSRSPGVGLGAAPRTWNAARKAWCDEMARILVPGGRALLVVGDGVVGNAPENALEATAEAAERSGLSSIAYASQERPPLDSRLREIFDAHPRREHLILFGRS